MTLKKGERWSSLRYDVDSTVRGDVQGRYTVEELPDGHFVVKDVQTGLKAQVDEDGEWYSGDLSPSKTEIIFRMWVKSQS